MCLEYEETITWQNGREQPLDGTLKSQVKGVLAGDTVVTDPGRGVWNGAETSLHFEGT